jgi:hypothetical protein
MKGKPLQLDPSNIETSESTIPMGLRIVAMLLRALFLGALVVVTVRVSSPQSETIWSVYETPGDLIRLALGFAVCLWIVIHLFMRRLRGAEISRPACSCIRTRLIPVRRPMKFRIEGFAETSCLVVTRWLLADVSTETRSRCIALSRRLTARR